MRKGIWSAAAVIGLLSVAGALAVTPWAGAAGSTVRMIEGPGDPTKDWKFDPAEITVPAGTTVTWQNSGQQPHTVAADDGSFKSDYISPGGSFQHTFATAGTYAYHCEPHPWMKAVVHVTGGATPATAASATPTTQAGGAASAGTPTTATTARTAAAASSPSTSTTTAPGGGAATATTTTAPATGGTTTTTAVAASTGGAASAAPATDNSTTTTTAAALEESAASSRSHGTGKTDTALVVLAGIVTVLLLGLTLRLLAGKS
ncbi:MAG TPA: plastocyanin/azurin family copper-binding protein [Acidimicrobiia bacterium]|nr:plastocyanin/azurin family copper-binding protein [Acidimicrobiia bacterium]